MSSRFLCLIHLLDVTIHVHGYVLIVKGLVGDANQGHDPARVAAHRDVFAPREHRQRGRRAQVQPDGVVIPLVPRELVPVADPYLQRVHVPHGDQPVLGPRGENPAAGRQRRPRVRLRPRRVREGRDALASLRLPVAAVEPELDLVAVAGDRGGGVGEHEHRGLGPDVGVSRRGPRRRLRDLPHRHLPQLVRRAARGGEVVILAVKLKLTVAVAAAVLILVVGGG